MVDPSENKDNEMWDDNGQIRFGKYGEKPKTKPKKKIVIPEGKQMSF